MSLKRHALAGAMAAFAAFATLLPILATAAYADIQGDCQATIKGVDLRPLSRTKASDAIEVGQNESAPVAVTAGFPILAHRVEVRLAGRTVYSDEKPDDGDTSWNDVVAINDYGLKSVGLYEVAGIVLGPAGQSCTGGALVKVEGNPLTTPLGAAAAGAAAVGTVGVAASAVASARGPRFSDGQIDDWVLGQIETGGAAPPPKQRTGEDVILDDMERLAVEQEEGERMRRAMQADDARRQERFEDDIGSTAMMALSFCAVTAIPALLMTAGMMAVGGGGGGAERRQAAPKLRVPYRPRFTVVSIVGGVLAGASGAVLLQQYAIRPLTEGLAIQGLAGGLVVGLLLPSLFRIIAWRRLNRRIARAVERRSRGA